MESINIQDKLRQNIKLTYIYTMLMNTMFDRGIWVLFLSMRGMSLLEIGLIESIYQLSSLLFGIPAGAISDILGRKVSLILSSLMRILSYIVLLLSFDFIGFSASFALSAMSYVLYSGAQESLTYDTCKAIKKEADYKKIYGNLLAIAFLSTAAGIVLGGFMANTSFEYAYYACIIVLIFALLPALFIKDTRCLYVDECKQKMSLSSLLSKTLDMIGKNPIILYILVLSAAITTVDATIYMYSQKYFESMAIPVYFIGLILSFDSIIAATGAKFAYMLERFGNRNIIAIIPAIILGSYIIYALIDNPVSIIFLYIATIFVVAFWPIISEILNSRIPSDNRATVISLKSQLQGLGIMIVFPVTGFLAESSSLSMAFLWLIISMAPLVVYIVIKIRSSAF
jgi:MFS family permease